MNSPYMAPHRGGPVATHHAGATNAALLIDFDNVTMGIRSDLTKELKQLLNSSIIKGKVAVQRAYADWRRYPQYIVPLSEGSVDLIFAPAYGSSKKNATDIRLAIDALELVFTRPEIGTFILLSGDSDFSSLVLKLKEYGKYVIGVGIKESSSDLLVQNCDEYYSYNALTGLTRAGEEDPASRMDPWDLVQAAVERMAENDDVMRSDRLKQVMIEMDQSFDEKGAGYSKYNRFLSEAATKGRIKLRKLENGQFEVAPAEGRRRATPSSSSRPSSSSSSAAATRSSSASSAASQPAIGAAVSGAAITLDVAYDLLRRAVRDLAGSAGGAVRDSDVKRRMLELRSDWDETAVGFGKFSHFLRQAHNSEIIDLQRTGEGLYEVVLPAGAPASAVVEAEDEAEEPGADVRAARMERGSGGRGDSERESSSPPSRGGRSRGGRGRGGRDRGEGEERERESRPRGGRGRGRGRAESSELPPSEPRLSGDEATGGRAPREERPSRSERGRPELPKSPEEIAAREEAAAQAAFARAQARLHEEQERELEAAQSGVSSTPTRSASTPASAGSTSDSASAPAPTASTSASAAPPAGLGRGRRGPRRGAPEGPPPLLPGQAIDVGGARSSMTESQSMERPASSMFDERTGTSDDDSPIVSKPFTPMPELEGVLDPKALGLPTEAGAVTRYLTNRYRGVGDKTAEQLVETFGAENVFAALQAAPDKVSELVGAHRAAALLDAWQQDYSRRSGTESADAGPAGSAAVPESSPDELDDSPEAPRASEPLPEPHYDDDEDETTYAATPLFATKAETDAFHAERESAEGETEPSAGVEREQMDPSERETVGTDVERETPDLWGRPREPQGE